ncbi:MAG: ABC transporter substrate-binding protein [Firmicutes bacterium]|nr:ABC transporter substrate-binding protein [Bacillota bacterium]
MKKLVFLCMAVLLLVTVAACGRGNGGGAAAGGVTTLTFWTFGDSHAEYFLYAQNLWNERNPDRQIELDISVQPFGAMHENLLMALEVGSGAPDLVDVEVGRARMFLNTPHVPFLPQNEVLQPYMPYLIYSRLEPWMSGGNYFGVCYHVGSVLMFYNIGLFEQAELDWNDIVTWQDFIEMGKLMVERTGAYMIQVEGANIWSFSAMVAQQGSDYVIDGRPNLDSPEAIRALTLKQDMIYTYGIGRPMVGLQIDAEEFYAEIATNNFAALIAPAWYMGRYLNHAPNQSGNIALAPLPVFEIGNNRSSSAGGTMTAVTNQVAPANQQLALEFVAFAKASYEMAILQWTLLGFDPVRWDVLDSPALRVPSPALEFFGAGVFDVLKDIADETTAVRFSGAGAFEVRDHINVNILPNTIVERNLDARTALIEAQAILEADPRFN